jgi:hypothetical protein
MRKRMSAERLHGKSLNVSVSKHLFLTDCEATRLEIESGREIGLKLCLWGFHNPQWHENGLLQFIREVRLPIFIFHLIFLARSDNHATII